jgi:hypothetical protein
MHSADMFGREEKKSYVQWIKVLKMVAAFSWL